MRISSMESRRPPPSSWVRRWRIQRKRKWRRGLGHWCGDMRSLFVVVVVVLLLVLSVAGVGGDSLVDTDSILMSGEESDAHDGVVGGRSDPLITSVEDEQRRDVGSWEDKEYSGTPGPKAAKQQQKGRRKRAKVGGRTASKRREAAANSLKFDYVYRQRQRRLARQASEDDDVDYDEDDYRNMESDTVVHMMQQQSRATKQKKKKVGKRRSSSRVSAAAAAGGGGGGGGARRTRGRGAAHVVVEAKKDEHEGKHNEDDYDEDDMDWSRAAEDEDDDLSTVSPGSGVIEGGGLAVALGGGDAETASVGDAIATGDNLVVSVLIDGSLVASDARTGKEMWRFDTGGSLVGAAATGQNPVVIPGADGSLYSVVDVGSEEGRARGSDVVMKKYPLGVKELVMETPALTNEGTTVVGLRRAYTFALSRRYGTLIASFPSTAAPQASALEDIMRRSVSAYDIDDVIFFGRTDYTIRSYDILTAMEAWNVTYAEVKQISHDGLGGWGGGGSAIADSVVNAKVSLKGEVHVFHEGVEKVVTSPLPAPAVSVYLLSSSGRSLQIMKPDGGDKHVVIGEAGGRGSGGGGGMGGIGGEGSLHPGLGVLMGSHRGDQQKTYALKTSNLIFKDPVDGSVCDLNDANVVDDMLSGHGSDTLGGCAAQFSNMVVPAMWSQYHGEVGESMLPAVRQSNDLFDDRSKQNSNALPAPVVRRPDPAAALIGQPRPTLTLALGVVLLGSLVLLGAVSHQYLRSSRAKEAAERDKRDAMRDAAEARKQARTSAAEMAEIMESSALTSFGNQKTRTVDADGHVTVGHVKYNSYDILGTGSVGTIVYAGEMDGRPVAVKRMLGQFYDIARKELGVLVKADDHPNIVRCCGWEEDDDFVYVALEQCQCSVADMVEGPRVINFRSNESDVDAAGDAIRLPKTNGVERGKKQGKGGGGGGGGGENRFGTMGGTGDVSTSQSNEIRQRRLNERMKQTKAIASRYRFVEKKALSLTDDGKRLIKEILSGLSALHDRKIIHRDLKPQNVLISFDGHAKISDMGLSKKLEGEHSSYHTQVSGTVGWQAPEQIRGDRQTRAVDAFSMGCLIYYILTGGKHPFGEPLERSGNIMRKRPPLLVTLSGNPSAQHLVASMVSLDAKTRWTPVAALHHPLWWTLDRTLGFVKEVSNRLELEDRADDLSLLRRFEKVGFSVFGGIPWDKKLPKLFIENLGQRRKYCFYSLRDFTRAIRNKVEHFDEIPMELRALIGKSPEEMLKYFVAKFPLLVVTLFDFARKEFGKDKVLSRFIDHNCASAPDVGSLAFPGDDDFYSESGAILSVEKWMDLAMTNVELKQQQLLVSKAESDISAGVNGGYTPAHRGNRGGTTSSSLATTSTLQQGKRRGSKGGAGRLPIRPDAPICEVRRRCRRA